jgi:hypothetical protein
MTDEPPEKIDLSCFSGILHRDTDEKSRNCWTVPDSKNFKVRSKNFARDKSKVQIFHFMWVFLSMSGNINNPNTIMSKLQIPAASYLMELAAIDWFKDTKRMDNVARQKGCVAQVTKSLPLLSLLLLIFLLKVLSSFLVSHVYYFYCFFRLLQRKGCIHLL